MTDDIGNYYCAFVCFSLSSVSFCLIHFDVHKHFEFYIILINWYLYHQGLFLSIIVFIILKSTSVINIGTLLFLWFVFVWHRYILYVCSIPSVLTNTFIFNIWGVSSHPLRIKCQDRIRRAKTVLSKTLWGKTVRQWCKSDPCTQKVKRARNSIIYFKLHYPYKFIYKILVFYDHIKFMIFMFIYF